jgi:hypothetical protein
VCAANLEAAAWNVPSRLRAAPPAAPLREKLFRAARSPAMPCD